MKASWSDGVAVVGEKPNRKVVAKRRLRRGEVILREAPTATLLHPKQWSVRCNFCFSKPSTKLLRCSQCRQFWYCSKACQRKDWTISGHKQECKALSTHAASNAEQQGFLADALLVARVIRLRQSSPKDYQTIMDLVFHKECIQSSHHDIAKLFLTMTLLDDSANNAMNTTTREIVELLARFDSNNFGIVDELLFFLGAGVYPAGAMLNHSCNPNCAIAYIGVKQVIRCMVDVAAGEELCHSYIDFASTSSQRRDKLQRTYGFDCHCSRCLDETGKWARADAMLQAPAEDETTTTADRVIAETEALLQQAAMTEDIDQELSLIETCVTERARVLHPRHLALYLARSQLHTTSMAARKLSVARDQCEEIVKTMEQCFYRPEHPLIGIMRYTLGSLHHSLNSLEDAIQCYETALPILVNYHGSDHSFTVGCRDYLQQARQEAGATRN